LIFQKSSTDQQGEWLRKTRLHNEFAPICSMLANTHKATKESETTATNDYLVLRASDQGAIHKLHQQKREFFLWLD
jgi:hypothetical protein